MKVTRKLKKQCNGHNSFIYVGSERTVKCNVKPQKVTHIPQTILRSPSLIYTPSTLTISCQNYTTTTTTKKEERGIGIKDKRKEKKRKHFGFVYMVFFFDCIPMQACPLLFLFSFLLLLSVLIVLLYYTVCELIGCGAI